MRSGPYSIRAVGPPTSVSRASLIVVLLPSARSQPDPRGESVRGADELDVPGELAGDPEAGAAAGAGREEARRRVIEPGAAVDHLADEAALDRPRPNRRDAAAVDARVGRDLVGREQQVEDLRLG